MRALLSQAIDFIHAAQDLLKLIPEEKRIESDNGHDMVLSFFSDVLVSAGYVLDMGALGTVDVQVTDPRGVPLWEKLDALMDDLGKRRGPLAQALSTEVGHEYSAQDVLDRLSARLDEGTLFASQFVDSIFSDATSGVETATARLAKIAGGRSTGGDWKDGCPTGAIDAVLAHASKTVFREKGLSNQLTKFLEDLKGAENNLTTVKKEYRIVESTTTVSEAATTARSRAYTTLTECSMMQILKKKDDDPDKKRLVVEEIEKMSDRNLTTQDIQGDIFAAATICMQ